MYITFQDGYRVLQRMKIFTAYEFLFRWKFGTWEILCSEYKCGQSWSINSVGALRAYVLLAEKDRFTEPCIFVYDHVSLLYK